MAFNASTACTRSADGERTPLNCLATAKTYRQDREERKVWEGEERKIREEGVGRRKNEAITRQGRRFLCR